MSAATTDVTVLRARWQRLLAAVTVGVLPWLVAPGLVQPDTKLDLTLAPWRYLARATSAWSDHNGVGELQNQAYGYLFPMGPVHGLLELAGLPPWAVQRAWWTLILVVALLGADRLIRRLGVHETVPALVGGLAYALSPRVLTMLTESSVELWPYAVAPWLVLVATRATVAGAAAKERRRAALRTAALVVCLGGVNATVNMAALAPAALWILLSGRGAGRWRALGWWLVAVLAGSLWWLAPLVVLGRYSYPFLDYIELASTTTAVTSVVNVLRGADHWLAYILTEAGHPVWQSGWVLAQAAVAIIGTCLLAGLGLAGLLRAGDRPATPAVPGGEGAHVRRWALTSVLLGVVVMGAGRSGTMSGPLAEGIQALLDGPLAPLRNVHKADLLVRLPVALGVGLVAARLTARRTATGPWRRPVGAALVAAGLLGSMLPLWQGRVADAWGYEGVPLSVRQTAGDIDAEAERSPGATLVLPAARMAHQSWGRTNDDPLSALARSPVIVRAAAPLGHPGATRLMDRVDRLASTGHAEPDLVIALQRLGVTQVVVRHDVVADEHTLDPDRVEATLEATPGIEHLRTRGAGETALTRWRVAAPSPDQGGVTSRALDGTVVAATSPEGVVDLQSAGLLEPGAPVVLAGDAAPLGRGPEIVTDGLRWQLYNAGRPADVASSPTVSESNRRPETTGTRALSPGDDPTWATVRTWPGYSAVQVSSSSADPFAGGRGPASAGPASLVDDDPGTTWLSAPEDPSPTIVLVPRAPDAVDSADVDVHLPDGEHRPSSLRVRVTRPGSGVGAQEDVPVPPTGSTVTIGVPPGYERLEITAVPSRPGAPVGVSEVDIGLHDVPASRRSGTALTLPDATGARAVLLTRDPRAAADLSDGEDPASLRRSVTGLEGPLAAEVLLRPRGGPALERYLDGGWDLTGSTRAEPSDLESDVAARPGAALDGDPATRWQPREDESAPTLRIDLGSVQAVSGLRLRSDVGGLVRVRTDAGLGLVPARQGMLAVPLGPTRTIELTFARRGGGWAAPEIDVLGPARRTSGPVSLACGEAGLLRVDGREVPLRAVPTLEQLRAGTPFRGEACGALPAAAPDGIAVEAVAGEAVVPQRVALTTGPRPPAEGGARQVEGVAGGVEERTVRLGAGGESLLATTQGANEGWVAVDGAGERLRPLTVDGWRQAFVVPAGEATTVSIRFVPTVVHRAGLLGGGSLAVLCLLGGAVSILRERLRSRGQAPLVAGAAAESPSASAAEAPVRGAWVGVLLGSLVGILVAGPWGLVAGAVGALVPAHRRGRTLVVLLALAGVVLAALGAVERYSDAALVGQLLGAGVLGILSAALAQGPRWARPLQPAPDEPVPAPGAPRTATTQPPPRPSGP